MGVIIDIGVIVGLPVLRSAAGWAVNALEDSKVTEFEWKQLGATVVRIGAIGLVAYLGINSMGLDIPALATAAGAFLADILIRAVKKK